MTYESPLLNRNEALLEELGTDLQASTGSSFFQANRDLRDWFSLDFERCIFHIGSMGRTVYLPTWMV